MLCSSFTTVYLLLWIAQHIVLHVNAVIVQDENHIHSIGNISEYVVGQRMFYVVPKIDNTINAFLQTFGEWEQPAIDFLTTLIDYFVTEDRIDGIKTSYTTGTNAWPHIDATARAASDPSSTASAGADYIIPEPGVIFFDIGANIGTWTVPINTHIEKYGGSSHTYAFEAVYDTFLYLCANLAINGIRSVSTINKAIGMGTGSILTPRLFGEGLDEHSVNVGAVSLLAADIVPPKSVPAGVFSSYGSVTTLVNESVAENSTSSRVRNTTSEEFQNKQSTDSGDDTTHGPSSASEPSTSSKTSPRNRRSARDSSPLGSKRRTEIVSLDYLLAKGEVPCPDVIKFDIEMYELYGLRGARKLLKTCRPLLFLEMDCFALTKSVVLLLDSLGYTSKWTLLPPMYLDDRTFRGQSWRDIDHKTLQHVLTTAPKSLTALPNEKAHLFEKLEYAQALFPTLRRSVSPSASADGCEHVNKSGEENTDNSTEMTHISAGNAANTASAATGSEGWCSQRQPGMPVVLYIQDYNLTVCAPLSATQRLCFPYQHDRHPSVCAGIVMKEEDILFWQTL